MNEHPMSEEMPMRDYAVTIEVLMPGQTRTSAYKIAVKARSNAEALVKGEEEWIRATEPRDVRVKELEKVITAS